MLIKTTHRVNNFKINTLQLPIQHNIPKTLIFINTAAINPDVLT